MIKKKSDIIGKFIYISMKLIKYLKIIRKGIVIVNLLLFNIYFKFHILKN